MAWGLLELSVRLNQVAAEGDVEVTTLTVDGVVAVPLEHAHPDSVTRGQRQQQALCLHHAALAGLRIQHGCSPPVAHDVQVCLLVIPGVHVEAQEVDAGHGTEEAAGGQVEGTIQVHQLRVEGHSLEDIGAVQPLSPAHREGHIGTLAQGARRPHLPLLALVATEAPGAGQALLPATAGATSDPRFTLLTCGGGKGKPLVKVSRVRFSGHTALQVTSPLRASVSSARWALTRPPRGNEKEATP